MVMVARSRIEQVLGQITGEKLEYTQFYRLDGLPLALYQFTNHGDVSDRLHA